MYIYNYNMENHRKGESITIYYFVINMKLQFQHEFPKPFQQIVLGFDGHFQTDDYWNLLGKTLKLNNS